MTAVPSEAQMTSVRTFSSSARSVAEPVEAAETIAYDYEITDPDTGKVLDTRTVEFHAPDTNMLVMMLARLESAGNLELAGTTVNFFMSLIPDDDDVRYFNRRLFNPKDPFDISNIAETLSAIVEDWGDRPTEPASASSASPSGRGKTSKGKRHGHASGRGSAPSASGSPSSTTTSGPA